MRPISDSSRRARTSTSFGYDLAQQLVLFLGSFLLLALTNAQNLVRLLGDQAPATTNLLYNSVTTAYNEVAQLINMLPYGATIITGLFWALVGIVSYQLMQLVISVLVTFIHQQSLFTAYTFPVATSRSSIIRSILFHWLLVIGLAILLLFCTILLIGITLPVAHDLFMNGLYAPRSFVAWLYTGLSTLAFAVNLQLVVWLTRLVWRSRKLLDEE